MEYSTEAKMNDIVHIPTQMSLTNITLNNKKQVVEAYIAKDSIYIA